MADLQQQGVPIPSRLRGPNATVQSGNNVPPAPRRTVKPGTANASPSRNATRNRGRARRVRDYNPATVGSNATGSISSSGGSVGTLEAEFLVGLGLLILLMFSSSASYSDKIMSVMKRGALMCVAFFILALVSSAGPNAAKISKAFGALLVVAILVTSPVNQVITDLDNLIKNDWVGSAETGASGTPSTSNPSASSGTQQSTNSILGNIPPVSALPLPGSAETQAISGIVKKILGGIGIHIP